MKSNGVQTKKRTILLRHATTWMNYVTIAMEGLQVEACNPGSRRQGIWLHRPGKTAWAIIHTMTRHNVPLEEVYILDVAVDMHTLKKQGNGLWYSTEDIPASAIRGVYQGLQIAEQSAVEEETG